MSETSILVQEVNTHKSRGKLLHFLCDLAKTFRDRTAGEVFEMKMTDMKGPFLDLNGKCISDSDVSLALKMDNSFIKEWKTSSNVKTGTATFIMETPFAKWDQTIARSLTTRLRDVAEEVGEREGYEVIVFSHSMMMLDEMDTIYAYMVLMVAVIVAATLLIVAVVFNAWLIPFKFMLTICLPISAVFGIAMLVYGKPGILAWLGLDCLSPMGGMGFFLPFISIGMMMGLAMDYELFLFFRVVEYRDLGWSNRAAALKAVHQVGPAISSSALVMSFAFGLLLISDVEALNQFGFVLVLSVLIDAFFMRSILEPCVLSLMPDTNFWPRVQPPVTKSEKHLFLLDDGEDQLEIGETSYGSA